MGFLKKLTKLGIDTVTTPLSVAADIITLGGVTVDKSKPFTVEKLQQILEDYEEVRESLDE